MRRPRHRRRRARGQSIVEYVILVAFLIMAVIWTFTALPRALHHYWDDVSSILSLPIP
jgi:Flp pilus assembly pilin Flp